MSMGVESKIALEISSWVIKNAKLSKVLWRLGVEVIAKVREWEKVLAVLL